MLNEGFSEDQIEMGFFPFPANMLSFPLHQQQTILSLSPSPSPSPPLQQHYSKSEPDLISTSHSGTSNTYPLKTLINGNHWAWGEVSEKISNKILGMSRDDHHIGVSGIKMKTKKFKSRRKVREPRFCFKTMSDVDVMDDGYKWRKYGQKVVKNTQHPRSYYRCTQDSCRVKKRVERLAEDPRMVITTYEGRHAHLPSPNEENSEANSSKLCNFFWL